MTHPHFSQPKAFTLLEIMIFMVVIAISMTATLSIYISQRLAQRSGEERRLASIAAEQKIDEIRNYIQSGNTLDQAFTKYGPLPVPGGGPSATFAVPGLE